MEKGYPGMPQHARSFLAGGGLFHSLQTLCVCARFVSLLPPPLCPVSSSEGVEVLLSLNRCFFELVPFLPSQENMWPKVVFEVTRSAGPRTQKPGLS